MQRQIFVSCINAEKVWVPVKCETKSKRNKSKRNSSKRNEIYRNETKSKRLQTKRNFVSFR